MAKTGGTIAARNTDGGVAFTLTLPRPAQRVGGLRGPL